MHLNGYDGQAGNVSCPSTDYMTRHRLSALSILLACSVSEDQEIALGRQNADQVNAALPIVTDPAVSAYIQELGSQIARTTSRADLDWQFYVINTPQVNAFALPGGYIYINRGLIESTDRLDQLAGTLGHEIGHVIQRHSVKQMETARKTNVGVAVLCTLTNICESGLGQAAMEVGGSAFFARHTRLDELQADSEAVVNVTRAGFDPNGVPALFEALLEQREYAPTTVEGWFASHPMEEARIERAKRLIADLGLGAEGNLLIDTPNFQAFRARLARLPAAREPPQPP